MKKPIIEVEIDHSGSRFLSIQCPDCDHRNRFPVDDLVPDTQLPCRCGVGFNFTQKSYDDLTKLFGNPVH